LFKQPSRIERMAVGRKGGAALFDKIILGRTQEDLPMKP
jgi:hypothetical protein